MHIAWVQDKDRYNNISAKLKIGYWLLETNVKCQGLKQVYKIIRC